jgi:hypothetical protein
MEKIAWQQWQERFEYWRQFCLRKDGYVTHCRDWWLSRFNDDHPKLHIDLDILWERCLAPALYVNLGTKQLRLM